MNVKSEIRKVLAGHFPRLLWMLRCHRPQNIEDEIKLIPLLADPSRSAVDVGAARGVYTYYFRNCFKTCYAIEANPVLYRELDHAIGRFVRVLNYAASDKNTQVFLRIANHCIGEATIEERNTLRNESSDHVESIEVPSMRLDDMKLDPVAMIKIDVEGHEEAVLMGGEQLLRRDHPAIIVEVEERHNPGNVARVRTYLEGLGYHGFFLRDGGICDIATFDLAHDQAMAGDGYINNFIWVHDCEPEKVAALKSFKQNRTIH